MSVEAGPYEIRLIHAIPRGSVTYSIRTESRSFGRLPPLKLPQKPRAVGDEDPCAPSKAWALNVRSEVAVARAIADGEYDPACTPVGTTVPVGRVDIRLHEELTIVVERSGDDLDAKSWRYVIATPRKVDWEALYGFTFLPDQNDSYFLDPIMRDDADGTAADPPRFVLREQTNRAALELAPTVVFSWPTWLLGGGFRAGPVGMIGYDLSNIVVGGGLGVTINENVVLTLGAAVHQQGRLKGMYDATTDTLTTNLPPDDLIEETFRPNVIFGISFRLGSDPFAEPTIEEPEVVAPGTNDPPQTGTATDAPGHEEETISESAAQQLLYLQNRAAGACSSGGVSFEFDPNREGFAILDGSKEVPTEVGFVPGEHFPADATPREQAIVETIRDACPETTEDSR